MRVFLAISPPKEFRSALYRSRDRLRRVWTGIRWIPGENYHITLVFFGDQNPNIIDAIKNALPQAVAGCRAFDIEFTGPRCFGHPERPKLFYEEIGCGRETLLALHAGLKPFLEPIVGWEARPYRPHLTLGRPARHDVKALEPSILLPPGMKNGKVCGFRVTEVALFSSELRPKGALYTQVATWNLEGP